MPYLYLTEQGAYIRKKGPHIQVVKESEILAELAIKEVEGLLLFGAVHPTSEAMLALLEAGADIAFMTQNGHFKGRLTSASGKNSVLRAKQYETFSKPQYKLEMARKYVSAKIKNGIEVLYAYHRNPNNPFEFYDREKLREIAEKALYAESMESLRGFEGAAARIYYANFGRCLMHGRTFPGRIFHPSTDPVNAILSFGYSFIAREIQSMLDALGLDPYIGFFHEVTYGRASLSLDLMEEFRHPVVDRLALRLFNKNMLDDNDFETNPETQQVYLKKESLKIFIRHYEEWANEKNRTWGENLETSWRQAMWKQGEKLRHSIENDEPYTPFCWNETEES